MTNPHPSPDRVEETALGRLTIFAGETNDYTIRAEQFRPDVRELLKLVSESESVTVNRVCSICKATVASYPQGMSCHCAEMPWPIAAEDAP